MGVYRQKEISWNDTLSLLSKTNKNTKGVILLVQIVKHHIKYIETHGIDEVILMTRSDHQKLHRRLRKEGKLNIPVEELNRISQRAGCREPDLLHTNGLEVEYAKQMELKEKRYEYNSTSIGKHNIEITFDNAAEMLEKTVKPTGNGAQVLVPRAWMDSRVAVVRLEATK